MNRVSQETGFDAYINHVPGGERRSSTHVQVCAPRGGLVASFGNPAIQILHSEKNQARSVDGIVCVLPCVISACHHSSWNRHRPTGCGGCRREGTTHLREESRCL